MGRLIRKRKTQIIYIDKIVKQIQRWYNDAKN